MKKILSIVATSLFATSAFGAASLAATAPASMAPKNTVVKTSPQKTVMSDVKDTDESGYLSVNAGMFDVDQNDNGSSMLGLEYRFGQLAQKPFGYGLRPVVGAFINSDKGRYAYGGIQWEFDILPHQLYIIPSTAVGAYAAGDDSKKLGGTVEFRSGVEVAYQLECGHRIGLAFDHISNAGIYNDNPGTETLTLSYSIPVN